MAKLEDLPALQRLIPRSVRDLSAGFYTPEQIESAIRHVFGPDTQLIRDRTYYVAEAGGAVIGCGGWSKRQTTYGGDQADGRIDALLDPARDAARIRAFFVHPQWARRGIGSAIASHCFQAARSAGFSRFELVATLPGEPLYRTFGFEVVERIHPVLPDGVQITFVVMASADPGIRRVDIDANNAEI